MLTVAPQSPHPHPTGAQRARPAPQARALSSAHRGQCRGPEKPRDLGEVPEMESSSLPTPSRGEVTRGSRGHMVLHCRATQHPEFHTQACSSSSGDSGMEEPLFEQTQN